MARDAVGNTKTSSAVVVTVSNATPDTTPPAVSLTAPMASATVSGTVAVSASTSDIAGIASVQFTLNAVSLGSPDATTHLRHQLEHGRRGQRPAPPARDHA